MAVGGRQQDERCRLRLHAPQGEGRMGGERRAGQPRLGGGHRAGMRIDAVNGVELRDIIDWRWEADGDVAELEVYVPEDDEVYGATLYREPGQDWGIDFTDVLFDGIRTCVNACQFCFMAMLPEDARASLMLRDDDYRLSFLQGNFVTLTNVSDEEVERIIACRLEPMNVSLHAISPEVRRSLIGRNAQRGMDVLERLLDAGIEVHGQIVLCAGINDGDELRRTLDWVEAARLHLAWRSCRWATPSTPSASRPPSRRTARPRVRSCASSSPTSGVRARRWASRASSSPTSSTSMPTYLCRRPRPTTAIRSSTTASACCGASSTRR